MSDETTKPADQPREYSQAEIDKMRKADIDDYKKENAWLEQRAKNATFLAEIEVQETRRLMAIMQRFQITRPAAPQEPSPDPAGEGPQAEGQNTPKAETPQGKEPIESTPQAEVPNDEVKPARTLKTAPKAE